MGSVGSWGPSIFEEWFPAPINFGKKGLKFTHLFVKNKQELRVLILK